MRTGGASRVGRVWRLVVRRATRWWDDGWRAVGEGEEVVEETERLRWAEGVWGIPRPMGGGLRGEVWDGPYRAPEEGARGLGRRWGVEVWEGRGR